MGLDRDSVGGEVLTWGEGAGSLFRPASYTIFFSLSLMNQALSRKPINGMRSICQIDTGFVMLRKRPFLSALKTASIEDSFAAISQWVMPCHFILCVSEVPMNGR